MKMTMILALIALSMGQPALGQSPEGMEQAQFRTGWQTAGGSYMTALDLQLQPGWKTYWRAPGDAGIPPQFDWAGSDNIGRVQLHWPSPQVFDLNGLRSIGYHDQMILPVEIFAADPARPVTIRLSMDLGICKEICLPATLTFAGTVSGAGASDAKIERALAARPLTADEAGVAGVACAAEPIKDGLRVTTTLAVPRINAQDEVVVLESSDRSIWISESLDERSGSTVTAVSDLVATSGKPFALDRSGLTVTLISGDASVEIKGCPSP